MLVRVPGRYFDGKSASRREVQVTLKASGIEIVEPDGAIVTWSYSELKAPERLPGRGGVRISNRAAPDAQLIVETPEFYGQLMRLLPRFGGRLGRWREHKGEIALVTLLVVAVVGGGIFGIPLLSRPLARVIPYSWQQQLGEMVLPQITGSAETCTEAAGVEALQRMLSRFELPPELRANITVRIIKHPMVNAFAAPGGQIVFMNGLIQEAKSVDEVAGVLAHELGHVVERHPTASAIRVIGVMTLLDLIMGDGSAVIEALSEAGSLLLLTAYSRTDEAAADKIALDMLEKADIDTGGLAAFFGRLAKKHNIDSTLLSYISTHPSSAEREKLAGAAAGRGQRSALSDADWKALRWICGEPRIKDGKAGAKKPKN